MSFNLSSSNVPCCRKPEEQHSPKYATLFLSDGLCHFHGFLAAISLFCHCRWFYCIVVISGVALKCIHGTCEKELQNYFQPIPDTVSESSLQVICLIQMKDEIMLKKTRNLHIGCLPFLQYASKLTINCFV